MRDTEQGDRLQTKALRLWTDGEEYLARTADRRACRQVPWQDRLWQGLPCAPTIELLIGNAEPFRGRRQVRLAARLARLPTRNGGISVVKCFCGRLGYLRRGHCAGGFRDGSSAKRRASPSLSR